MALIKQLNGIKPEFGKECYFSENTTIIGDVICGDRCSFWFNSVLRGDVNHIRLGKGVNVQDGAVLHGTYKESPTVIGDHVTIGHNAIVHGCTIKNNVIKSLYYVNHKCTLLSPRCWYISTNHFNIF